MTVTPFMIRKIAFIELILKTPHCSSGLYNQRVLVSNCFLFSLNSIFIRNQCNRAISENKRICFKAQLPVITVSAPLKPLNKIPLPPGAAPPVRNPPNSPSKNTHI